MKKKSLEEASIANSLQGKTNEQRISEYVRKKEKCKKDAETVI